MGIENPYNFSLTFEGQLVENSVDAFDLANTILATSAVLQEISIIRYGEKWADDIKIHVNAFRTGSLESPFLVFLQDNGPAIVPLLPGVLHQGYSIGKEILEVLTTILNIKEQLRGEKPRAINQRGSNIEIVGNNNITIVIDSIDFRALQSKMVSKNISKMIQPLIKPNSEITNIKITEDGKQLSVITREMAPYLAYEDEIQTVNSIKYKGVITKIDTKVNSGYINVGSKRIPFNYSDSLSKEEFALLIESLRSQIQIYLIGEVVMDFESNPRSIIVNKVASDLKLF